MFPRIPSPLIRTHGPPLLLHRRNGFVRRELEELQSLIPTTPPAPEPARGRQEETGLGEGERRVEMSHPWPEWVHLMDRLLKRGYLDRGAFESPPPSSPSSSNASKDSNHIRTACLNFARDRFNFIRYFSRRDIQIVVGSGCPSLDRKVVNSGKRLRAHVGIEEGDVCSSCNLRGSCERAYVKAREDEGGRTVDVMRILLTYGLDVITGSVENPACVTKNIKGSVRKLLNEIAELDVKEVNSGTPMTASGRSSSMIERSSGLQMPGGQIAVPVKQGDWICPKCNFLNFAKNIKCLRCNGLFQERLKKLREDSEHLPLKKGDWICDKCNFLNFAKNTKCLQCHEKPPKRQLNPGEWECVSCNYINFRRNMVCLKCDWKRPKAFESQHDEHGHHKHTAITSIRNSGDSGGHQFVRDSCPSQEEEDTDFWSSEEDRDDDEDPGATDTFDEFDKFPIVGGKGATSQDPLARESWKEEMSRSRRGVSGKSCNEKNGDMSFARFSSTELDDSSGEDDIAGWFGSESGK